jgi:acetylornithine deacetylase/succinyl-diaminopimelate desuccinylase-like protein
MTHLDPTRPLAHLKDRFDALIGELADFARIPGVSDPAYPKGPVRDSANWLAARLRAAGFENAEVVGFGDAHPYVVAEWLGAPGAPTLLLYGHHDVQPPGRPEKWVSPAFEPEVREGRLYGRGVVDDKAGVMIHVAALEAWLATHGRLPCNVKLIVEGEEEAGSESLEAFLNTYRERFRADCIVLTDTANLDTGVPSITYTLRGLVAVDVEVAALDHPLHSGMWGGPVPDPVMALCRILARLTREDGTIAIPGLYDRVRDDAAARERLARLPFDEARFRADAGLLEGVRFAGEAARSVYEKLWTRPSLTLTALEARPLKGAINQLVESARARVTIRVVPDQEPAEIQRLLIAALEADPPHGVRVTTTPGAVGGYWSTVPEGPAFEAAERALRAGFWTDVAYIGCGGSIPFVQPFADVLGGVPALLLGLEDPICNAHGENESLHLGDFRKATIAAIHLYAELARALRPGAGPEDETPALAPGKDA